MAEKTTEAVNEAEQEEVFTKAQVDELVEKEREGFESKLREMEKISQMNEQQRESYLRKQAEAVLSEREAAVARRELAADAMEKLSEYKLPKSLLSCVNFASPEDCAESIEGIRQAFTAAVSEAVSQRIGSAAPKFSAGNAKDAFLDGLFD
ncbi:MAG: DUF4355 domain-containing protein [Ruminiclostridium sp.]|nr:DUF4355 domain-containing protein [Ruminiclostridium sp.]